jgi:hypothetical protein
VVPLVQIQAHLHLFFKNYLAVPKEAIKALHFIKDLPIFNIHRSFYNILNLKL